jgi:signal recognition particle subunit SRP54
MIPGLGAMQKQLAGNKPDEKQMGRIEAIISSMTAEERRDEKLINGSRRKRIAAGSGTSVEDVNRLLTQFREMKKVLNQIAQGAFPGMPKNLRGRLPDGRVAEQALRQGGGLNLPGGKKRKKGGPWGLIKTR